MEQKMKFEVDRTTVTEGDVVEVQWDCTGADRVELKIDNGFKASVLPLDISGSKRFRLNRSKGRTALTITAWVGKRHGSKTLKVRVNPVETARAETVDEQGRRISGWHDRWQLWRARWQAMPERKRMASTVLLILAAVLLLGSLMPRLFSIGLIALMGYLAYVALKP